MAAAAEPSKEFMLDDNGQQFFQGILQVFLAYWSWHNSTMSFKQSSQNLCEHGITVVPNCCMQLTNATVH